MNEQWADIKSLKGYQVSNIGNVKTVNGLNRKLTIGTTGYYCSSFYVDGKMYFKKIHRLVAKAFIPNPENKPCVNHIDGNKLNNNVENLEWCTHKDNSIHAFKMGLSVGRKGADASRVKLTVDQVIKF